MVMRQRAVPGGKKEYDPLADPTTWDWQPVKVREKLRRNQLERKCNDVCWAVALVLVVCAYIAFAIYGATVVEWTTESKKETGVFNSSLITKALLQIGIASAFGLIFAVLWSHILKCCAGVMIKMSIFVFLGLKVVGIAMCIIAGGPVMYFSIGLGLSLLIHALYFWCVWHRIPMAEATLTIAVKVLHRYSCAMWISMLFSLLSILYIFMWFFGSYGIYRMCGFDFTMTDTMTDQAHSGSKSNAGSYFIWVISLFVLFWGSITIGYIVHAICAGVMGTWYFGTSRKRTITDAVVRALTTSLGSLSFAAFIVAVIKTLEVMVGDAKNKAARDGNAGLAMMACMVQCLLRWIGDMMHYFNSLAIVRVAVYGESFCTAAKRTMNMIKYRGLDQLINDDLSSLPIWLGCWIIYMISVPCLFTVMYFITPTYAIVVIEASGDLTMPEQWMWSFIFSICALLIPISILNVIPSFVQSLYVLWGDDPAAFDEVHPQESHQLKAAAWECLGYKVVYDDHRIQGRGGHVYA